MISYRAPLARLPSLMQALFGIYYFFCGWLVEGKEERSKKMQVSDLENFEILHHYAVGELLSSLSWDKRFCLWGVMELL